ncbi:MAG: hypothetical protein N3B01_01425 [Verrucomicrobiae bacterium]|nr:hypothetical protein [Verrucomicrobiae bacterium]
MSAIEASPGCGIIRVATYRWDDTARLRRAAQRIRWLPGVLAVDNCDGELQIRYRAPAEDLLRRIHKALSGSVAAQGFPQP